MLEKNNLVYLIGLVVIFLWDIVQAISAFGNGTLFFFSLLIIFVTTAGLLGTISDTESIQRVWMLWYAIPAGLMGLGAVQGYAELQNSALSLVGESTLPLPLEGSSEDYTVAVYSHYLSMCSPAVAWLAAYMAPLTKKIYLAVRA